MSEKKTPSGDYAVGYCRPPKASQFKPRRKKSTDRLDVMALLNAPVTVGKDGVTEKMPAFEVVLRAQVKKAIKEKSSRALLWVLEIAEKHELLASPPEFRQRGGVLIVPGRLTKEDWAELFEPTAKGEGNSRPDKSKKDK